MPDFRRAPDWEQHADRHTRITDPVITVRQLARFEFVTRKPPTRIDHALVFSTADGTYDTYLPPQRPSRTDAANRRYTAVYEVDMGIHPVTDEFKLPSDNDAFEFTAVAELTWQVDDPARFVASGHRDVPAFLLGRIQDTVRPVTRGFPVDHSASAEHRVREVLAEYGPFGAESGLRTTLVLRLRRDEETISHWRRMQAIDHTAAEDIHRAQRGREVDAEADRRARQQDELQISRAMAYGEQNHQLELQRGRQELELQEIRAKKIEFYQYWLQQGGVAAWAMHLSEHPEDARVALENMRQDQLLLIQSQMQLVKSLLIGDRQLEEHELEQPKQLALQAVSEILNQRLPGIPQSPSGVPGPGAPEQTVVPGWLPPTPPSPPAPQPASLAGWQPPPGYGSAPQPPVEAAPPAAPAETEDERQAAEPKDGPR